MLFFFSAEFHGITWYCCCVLCKVEMHENKNKSRQYRTPASAQNPQILKRFNAIMPLNASAIMPLCAETAQILHGMLKC